LLFCCCLCFFDIGFVAGSTYDQEVLDCSSSVLSDTVCTYSTSYHTKIGFAYLHVPGTGSMLGGRPTSSTRFTHAQASYITCTCI